MQAIEAAIDKMSKHHIRHIKAYDPREGKVNTILFLNQIIFQGCSMSKILNLSFSYERFFLMLI